MIHLIVDIAAVALVLGVAAAGYARGFVKTFFGLFGTLLALGLALFLLSPVSSFLKDRFVEPALSDFFLQRLSEETEQSEETVDFSALPEGAAALFSRYGVTSDAVSQALKETGKTVGEDVARLLAQKAVSGAASLLSRAIAFLSVFLLSSVLIWLLSRVLDLAAKMPGLKLPNRVFGLLTGILTGLALAYVFSVSVAMLQPVLRGSDYEWLNGFSTDKTYVVRFLSGWDPLKMFHI